MKTGTFSTLTRRLTALMPTCGSACVSSMIISSFLPLMPPLALMSSTAHCAAFTWSAP